MYTARVDWVRGTKWKIPWRRAAQDISSQNLHVRNEDHPQILQLFDTHFSKGLEKAFLPGNIVPSGRGRTVENQRIPATNMCNVVRVVSDSAECLPTELSFEKEHMAGSSSCVVNFVVDMASQIFSPKSDRPQSPVTIDLATVTYWCPGPTMMTHGITSCHVPGQPQPAHLPRRADSQYLQQRRQPSSLLLDVERLQ